MSWVLLDEVNQTFEFNRGAALSHRPNGTYTIEDDTLTLHGNGSTFVFTIEDDYLIFESGEMAEGFVDIGEKFYFTPED